MKISAILWHEYVLFKNKFWSITSSLMISPILYLIAFGWGLGDGMTISGTSYMNFVIPGIIAMSTMTISFGTVANSINISRMYDKTFEEFMVAPINMSTYAMGKIIASALRGMYSAMLIIILSLIFKANIDISIYFVFITILNCLVFAALGFIVGMLIDSHADMSKFSSFIITPMSFLCGTFFPIEKMPAIIKELILFLPLTQTSIALRGNSEFFVSMWFHSIILIIYFIILLMVGIKLCGKVE